MKIHFEQKGGLAGITSVAEIDTSHPSFSGEAHEIQSMVNSSKFFSLPPKITTKDAAARDHFTYTITMESDDGQKHTVETSDVSKPLELNSLISYLRKKAEPVRKKP